MEISYCELRSKEVVNTVNGKRLGRISDMVISCKTCKILGFVVPGNRQLFKTKEDLFIPWKNILKIGDDVILVQLFEASYAGAGKKTYLGENVCSSDFEVRDDE